MGDRGADAARIVGESGARPGGGGGGGLALPPPRTAPAAPPHSDPMPLTHSAPFRAPEKAVRNPMAMGKWLGSPAHRDYVGFLEALSQAIKGRRVTDVSDVDVSASASRLLSLLATLTAWIDDAPPEDDPAQRFGNKAYRVWFERLSSNARAEVQAVLGGAEWAGAAEELAAYLVDAFGNATRIDYGTGHEMAFLIFLYGLFRVGCLVEEDKTVVGLRVFAAYLTLCRHLQMTYRMEPAGSHGVYSLDDYQFVPFIFGAAQLCGHPRLEPKDIPDYEVANLQANDNHLFACIRHISTVKTGPFSEHSNQLWNISAVASWNKVHSGLMKMYRAEVLAKFPVVQHVLFGTIFPAP